MRGEEGKEGKKEKKGKGKGEGGRKDGLFKLGVSIPQISDFMDI